MIWRAAASVAAISPVAAIAAAEKGRAVAPTIWHFLGYPFEAAAMIAALFGCISARSWIGAGLSLRREHRWSLDVPVSGMALAVSAGVVMAQRPQPLYALLLGAGLGVVGEGIFAFAGKHIQKLTGGAISPESGPSVRPPAEPGAAASAGQLLRDAFPPDTRA